MRCEQKPRAFVVVHDEHPGSLQIAGWGFHDRLRGDALRLGGVGPGERDGKRTPFPLDALYFERAVHEIHEPPRDRQPEPAAFVATAHARRLLLELLEEVGQERVVDPDARVLDPDHDVLRRSADARPSRCLPP